MARCLEADDRCRGGLALLRLFATSAGANVAIQMGGRAAMIARRVGSRSATIIISTIVVSVFIIRTIEIGRNIYAIRTGN